MGSPQTLRERPAEGPSAAVMAELTPAMRGVVERMERAARPPLHRLTPEAARLAYAAGAGILEIPFVPMARVEDLPIPARDGAMLAARLFAPTTRSEPLPVLMYFHGGGFTVGDVGTHEALCRALAGAAGCAVMSVDYRCAPQHRFPVASNDAWDALAWLAVHAGTLGLDAERLAVGGDSAGGTLAIGCAVMARDAAMPLVLQLLFYPGCSAWQDSASYQRYAQGPVLTRALVDWFFGLYLRSAADREDWRFAPLCTPDFDGVAPAWLALAECDPLVDEGIAYADRLRMAGVPVDLEIWRGVTHEFIKMGRAIPEARHAHAAAAAALRGAFFP